MYSPKIKEEFIPSLYKVAKQKKKPMTVIVNEMIREALEGCGKDSGHIILKKRVEARTSETE